MRPVPRCRPWARAALGLWLVAWLGWQGVVAAAALVRELGAIDAPALAQALELPLDERVRSALGPFGARLLELLEQRTPPTATILLVAEEQPAAHRLWLGLSAMLFPRVIVPTRAGAALTPAGPCFVLVCGRGRGAPPVA
ncbi:MAG: hypothetical protein EXS08_10590 [Planctomycetes bacterium]|nr:hypothetical protein [Planctomycetota bacterium]